MGNSIQIAGGKYRGKKILLPDTDFTRPSKSIVRNSIFDTFQSEIIGRDFVEFFAGSGSVGFEALSRGVEKLYLLERGREALKTLQKNREHFRDEQIEIVAGDSFQTLPSLLEKLGEGTIFYIDPPFHIREGMENIYSKTISTFSKLQKSRAEFLIFEHISSEALPEEIGEFKKFKYKKFGKTSLSYYR
jgi:16S rRNA (guanine966-N2)-methyltransferase